jgi:drug/metabolite transporter (DMT)-like permease
VKRETAALTAAALAGFAANSLLCRVALRSGSIDAASFTAIRLVSGAIVLGALSRASGPSRTHSGGWASAAALFVYALAFSYAYLQVSAGVGALLLFGAVQITMIGWGVARGERPTLVQWAGLALAVSGLVVLTLPGIHASPPLGMGLMAIAGVAWGVYSLRGRGAASPLLTTAVNFARTVPMMGIALAVSLALSPARAGLHGVLLAIGSGAVASGIGYALWYRALPGLSAAQAASLQLLVPVLAAGAAVPVLGEALSLRLLVASSLVLGGIGLSIFSRATSTAAAPPTR